MGPCRVASDRSRPLRRPSWSPSRSMPTRKTRPRYGGELIFVVPAEPPSYDGHREGTFGMVHPLAPHYNTLLRIDPDRPDGHAARCRTWPSRGRSRRTGSPTRSSCARA